MLIIIYNKMKTDNKFNKLMEAKNYLVRQLNASLNDYRELQDWFKRAKTPKDAEYFFYKFKEAEFCQHWNEWEYRHQSLKSRMLENKKERNEIVEKIRAIKIQMKDYTRNINKILA